jgi:two-component system OmpR family sensor kinase
MSFRFRPRTLFRQVYLHGVLLLVLVMLCFAVAGIFLGRDDQFRTDPGRLAQHVGRLIAPLPDNAIAAQLPQLARGLDVNLAVYTDDGRRLAAAGRRPLPPLPPEEVTSLHAPDTTPRHRHLAAASDAGPGRYVRLSLRISHGELLLRFLGMLALVIGVLALASAPLARAISRPIEHLAQVARRIGEGDLKARADLHRKDEIGALGRTLDEMAERLGRLLESHRELLANVSHELRTPLARIRVSLSLVAEAPPGDAARHLQAIEEDVAELETLVGDLLTASRLDAGGGLVLRREAVAPRALVEATVVRFSRLHPGREVASRLEDVPDVEGEPALLARVLDNLLDNAARYSEPASPIEVSLAGDAGGIAIAVRDHGIGITPEDQARLFTPFFRADRSRDRHTGGVGLGLTLSKRIVEAHGGRIEVESRPGEGTTVRVSLPGARRSPSS